jgi:hypothetical protein
MHSSIKRKETFEGLTINTIAIVVPIVPEEIE